MILARVKTSVSSNGWFLMVRCDDASTELFQAAQSYVSNVDAEQRDTTDEFATRLMARHRWQPMPGMPYTVFHYRRICNHPQQELVGISVGGVGTNIKQYQRASALALAVAINNTDVDFVRYLSGEVLALQSQINQHDEPSACTIIPLVIPMHIASLKSSQ
jgi:hypothetical protein